MFNKQKRSSSHFDSLGNKVTLYALFLATPTTYISLVPWPHPLKSGNEASNPPDCSSSVLCTKLWPWFQSHTDYSYGSSSHAPPQQLKQISSTQLYHLQDSPEWLTSIKWRSNSASSPLQLQPSLLCVHKTCSWFNDRFKLLLANSSKFSSLHVGQGLCSAWSRSLHVRQKWVPQQLVRYGSRSIRLHIGHSVCKTLGGCSTNSQSYPPNISSCCGLPWGSVPPSAPCGVLVGGVFFCWASSASFVCNYLCICMYVCIYVCR